MQFRSGDTPANVIAHTKMAAEAAISKPQNPSPQAVLIQTALTLRYSSKCCLPDSRP